MCLKAILVVVGNRRRPKMRKSSSFFHTFIPTRLFCATLLLLFGGCLLLRGVSAKSRTAKLDAIVKKAKSSSGYCEKAVKMPDGPPICPTVGPIAMYYKEDLGKCCVYCAPALHLSKKDDEGNKYVCPTDDYLTWLVEDYNICCGSEKVGKGRHGSSRRRYRSSEADDDDDYYDDEDDEGTCKDLHLPGRGSDCGRSAHLCDDPLWKELMTEQCPKTCNRCPGSRKRKRKTHHRRDSSESVVERKRKKGARAGSRSECRDGTNAEGVSECPDRKSQCTLLEWKEFMSEECPKTCGTCTKTESGKKKRKRVYDKDDDYLDDDDDDF